MIPPRPAAAETAGKTPRPDGEIVAVLTGLNLSENGKKFAGASDFTKILFPIMSYRHHPMEELHALSQTGSGAAADFVSGFC
jgi:hypothetical protein